MARGYTWIFDTWFLVRPGIFDFWDLGGPGGPKQQFQKVGGFAPHLLERLLGPPGPPRPQKSTIPGRPKNHEMKTQVYPRVVLRSKNDSQ